MSNPEKLSHWKSLAELLGTEPPSEQDRVPSPPTSSSPTGEGSTPGPSRPAEALAKPPAPRPPEPPRSAAPKSAARKEGKSNWGKLASILGLAGTPAPEVEAERPLHEDFRPAEPTAPPVPVPSQVSDAAALAAEHWGHTEATEEGGMDPLEMRSEPFIDEAMDAIDLDTIEDRGGGDEPPPGDRPRRRRRRGRGRGRGRRSEGDRVQAGPPAGGGEMDDQPEAAPERMSEDAEEVEFEHVPFEEGADFGSVDEAPSDLPAATGEDTEEGRDPRRRRRRRGRGRRGRRDDRGGEGERRPPPRSETSPPARAADRSRDEAEDVEDDDLLEAIEQEGDLDGDEEKGDDDLQLSHKKIPSWQEAIESVISTNMTSRANNPSSSGSRGGRGRGRRDR